MVTVLGHSGYLGFVVEKRWRELGATGPYVVCAFDDMELFERLGGKREHLGGGVIIPSTDAIAEDTEYARRKQRIERGAYAANLVVIRAGIIDIRPERQPKTAYCAWECNPLTPLEWADLAWEKRDQPGVHIAGREPLTRYAVHNAVAQVFDYPPPKKRCGKKLDRLQPQDRERPDILTALREFKDWLA